MADRRLGGRKRAGDEGAPAAQKPQRAPVQDSDADAADVKGPPLDEDLVAQLEEETVREQLEEGQLDEQQQAAYDNAVAKGLKDNSRRDFEAVEVADSFADDMREIGLTLEEELLANNNTTGRIGGIALGYKYASTMHSLPSVRTPGG